MAFRAPAHDRGRVTLLTGAFALLALAVAASALAAGRAPLAKVQACAKGQHSTAQKRCKVVKTAATAVKEVPLAVCNEGQHSTAARPCITLTDNGPPPNSGSSGAGSSFASPTPPPSSVTQTTPATTTPAATTTPPLVGPHINSHLCQSVDTDVIFECQPIPNWDPMNPTPGNYPQIQN